MRADAGFGEDDSLRDPPRIPAWVQDLLAAVLVVGLAFAADPSRTYAPPSLAAVALAVVAALILPLRRRWPVPVLAAAVALYAVVAVFERVQSGGLELAVAIAMFGVGNRRELRIGITALACALAVAVPATALVTGALLDHRVFQVFLLLAFSGAAGDATRMHRGYIASIKERAVRAEQTRDAEARRRVTEERLRIARDLHDAVAHEISVISLNAGVASQTIDLDPAQARESLATVRSAARSVLGEIGDLLDLLRAEEGASAGSGDRGAADQGAADHGAGGGGSAGDPAPRAAVAPPQPGIDRIDALVARFAEAGLAVTTRVEGDLSRVPAATVRVAYRVVQEALTNAYKHGADRRAHVLLEVRESSLEIVVTNPMAATRDRDRRPADEAAPRGGHGIVGLRERVASVRGTVETGLVPGGWRTAVSLPIGAP